MGSAPTIGKIGPPSNRWPIGVRGSGSRRAITALVLQQQRPRADDQCRPGPTHGSVIEVAWEGWHVTANPEETEVDSLGRIAIPMSVLAEAVLNPGERVMAYSGGDGRIVLRRWDDALHDLLSGEGLR